MKPLKIVFFAIFAFGLMPSIPFGDALVIDSAAQTRYKTIYGTGKTEAEAYANAKSKIPSGWTESKATFKQIASNPVKFQCTLRLKK